MPVVGKKGATECREKAERTSSTRSFSWTCYEAKRPRHATPHRCVLQFHRISEICHSANKSLIVYGIWFQIVSSNVRFLLHMGKRHYVSILSFRSKNKNRWLWNFFNGKFGIPNFLLYLCPRKRTFYAYKKIEIRIIFEIEKEFLSF